MDETAVDNLANIQWLLVASLSTVNGNVCYGIKEKWEHASASSHQHVFGDDGDLVCFLWQLCSRLVHIKLYALVTSVSAALVQFVSLFSLVARRGQTRSPSDVVVRLSPFCLTVSVSRQVYGKVILPSLRKFLLVPGVRRTDRVWRGSWADLVAHFVVEVELAQHVRTVEHRDCFDTLLLSASKKKSYIWLSFFYIQSEHFYTFFMPFTLFWADNMPVWKNIILESPSRTWVSSSNSQLQCGVYCIV